MVEAPEFNRPSWLNTAIAIVALSLVVALVIAVAPRPPQYLYPGQVRDYEGVKLSSVGDVIENNIAGTQYINVTKYHLKVSGLVNNPLMLTYDQVVNNHQSYLKVVYIYCVEHWNATILWQGVLVKDLLAEAKANMSAPVVIFYASDGYSSALPMDYVVNKNILLAYKMNNLTMPVERGFPFQVVAESEFGYKWVKWVTGIEVSDNAGYLGYWESRGYPNNATIPNP